VDSLRSSLTNLIGSQYGVCGSTVDYCGTGCQPLYGACNNAQSSDVPHFSTVINSSTRASSAPPNTSVLGQSTYILSSFVLSISPSSAPQRSSVYWQSTYSLSSFRLSKSASFAFASSSTTSPPVSHLSSTVMSSLQTITWSSQVSGVILSSSYDQSLEPLSSSSMSPFMPSLMSSSSRSSMMPQGSSPIMSLSSPVVIPLSSSRVSSSSSAARSPIASEGITPDGSCGGSTAFTCTGSQGGIQPCCSSSGFCGAGPLYCGAGCQSDFGICDVTSESTSNSPSSSLFSSSEASSFNSKASSSKLLTSSSSSLAFVAFSSSPPVQSPTSTTSSASSSSGALSCTNIATSISCPASDEAYYDSAKIECGVNYAAGNIAGTGATTATMELCISSCLNTTSCVGGNWLPGPKKCYLKSLIGTRSSNAGVNGFHFTPGLVCSAAEAVVSSTGAASSSAPVRSPSQIFGGSEMQSSSDVIGSLKQSSSQVVNISAVQSSSAISNSVVQPSSVQVSVRYFPQDNQLTSKVAYFNP
jgi:hypothetical protein